MIRVVVSDPRNSGEFNKNRENGRKWIPERTDIPVQKFESPNDSRTSPKDSKAGNKRNQESTLKKEAPPCKPNGPGRPKPPSGEFVTRTPKPAARPNVNNTIKVQQNSTTQKKPIPHQREVCIEYIDNDLCLLVRSVS